MFSPIADREHESEALVFGPDGEGYGGDEIVLEVLVRGTGEGTRRAVERALEGWTAEGPCELQALRTLSGIWSRKSTIEEVRLFDLPTWVSMTDPMNCRLHRILRKISRSIST